MALNYITAMIKQVTIFVIILTIQFSCIGANKKTNFVTSKIHNGYVVKLDGKVINQLFVFTEQKGNKGEQLFLRVVLNHGYGSDYSCRFNKLNYHDFISALHCVFNEASETYDLTKLCSIEIDLISLGEECLLITKDYKSTFMGQTTINNQDILFILMRSKFISDIQCILSHYHSTIQSMKIETTYYTDWKEFSSYNIVNKIPNDLVSDKVIRGVVYINCNYSQNGK